MSGLIYMLTNSTKLKMSGLMHMLTNLMKSKCQIGTSRSYCNAPKMLLYSWRSLRTCTKDVHVSWIIKRLGVNLSITRLKAQQTVHIWHFGQSWFTLSACQPEQYKTLGFVFVILSNPSSLLCGRDVIHQRKRNSQDQENSEVRPNFSWQIIYSKHKWVVHVNGYCQ